MIHAPVLLNDVVNCFSYLKEKSGFFVDGTLGMAGHSIAIASQTSNKNLKIIGIDKDKKALSIAQDNIGESGLAGQFILVHDDFTNIDSILSEMGVESISGALIDLGVSSLQLDDKERGFSFEDRDAILDMRMNRDQKLDAQEVLNHYTESELAKIFLEYGDEKWFKTIARNICKTRKEKPICRVGDLLQVLEESIPKPVRLKSKKHYATNVFRALRIEVNNELSCLERSLGSFFDLLTPGGRLAVITFHSTEDRITKNLFRLLSRECSCPEDAPMCTCDKLARGMLVTKKPIVANQIELAQNLRSRSAKLRIIQKVLYKKKYE